MGDEWREGRRWRYEEVTRFFGRFEHSLDAKGRVILPAKFRTAFDHGGYLSQHLEGCLALWTPEEFEKRMRSMQEAAAGGGREERNLARVWASGCTDVEVDKSGRMVIPPHLRSFAGLDGDVLVLGAIDRVELWDLARWNEKVQPTEQQLHE